MNFWSHIWHEINETSPTSVTIMTYNLYSAILNYRRHGTLPPRKMMNYVQKILTWMDAHENSTLVLGRINCRNEDLDYNLNIWKNIRWMYCQTHTKMVILDYSAEIRVWVGSINLSHANDDGPMYYDLMLEIFDEYSRKKALKHCLHVCKNSEELNPKFVAKFRREEMLKRTILD